MTARPRLALVTTPPDPLAEKRATLPWNPAKRGVIPVYRHGEANRCPGCGRSHWIVRRATAECAFCETALPLAEVENVVRGERG